MIMRVHGAPRALVAATAFVALMTLPARAQTTSAGPAAGPGAGAPRTGWTPGRTPWGDPDVQGIFTNNDESGIPFERPGQFEGKQLQDVTDAELAAANQARRDQAAERAPFLGGLPLGSNPVHWFENTEARNSRAWLIVDPKDGRIPPLTPEAAKRPIPRGGSSFGNGPFNGPEDLSLYDRCITRGLPGSMMPAIYGNAYQIIQGPGFVAITYEMVHETRIIPLDGRPHLGGSIRQFMGDGRGRFEGNTLVIETTNFDPKNAYRNANTARLRLIERFTPVAPDTVEWSVTVEDPMTWTQPWTFAMNLTRTDDRQAPFEYACHEGNYGLSNLLSGARTAERDTSKR